MGNIISYIVGAVALISVFIEITPIKICPISSILKWVGDKITQDIKQQLKEQEKRQQEEWNNIREEITKLKEEQYQISLEQAENEVDKIRNEMLKFGRECRKDEKHTRQQFDYIISLYTKYGHLVDKYHIDNGVLELEYQYIERIYKKCQDKDMFL